MIPERLPYRASAGEQRLFSILQRLPDDCVVYYEPLVGSRRPDFVVLCPELGLLVIEVKGWYLGDVVSANPQEVTVRESGRPVQREHPLCQARNYMFSLLNHCQRHAGLSRLLNASGKHANKLCFPCGHLAVLSNITTAQLSGGDSNVAVGGLTVIFPPKQVVTRDVLLGWEDLSEAQLVEVLQTYFDPFWRFPRLSETQVNALRAVIHPEILLSPLLGLEEEEPTVKVLDLRQESHARSVGRGHRLLFGVAGSGNGDPACPGAAAGGSRRGQPSARALL